MNMKETYLDQYTYEHLPQAIALLDSDEWLQLFHPPVYPSEHEEIQKLRLAVSTVLTALSALRSPWVKTSDRLPTEADADNTMCWVFATTKSSNLPMPEAIAYIRANPDRYPYWMPFPPLPEVEG